MNYPYSVAIPYHVLLSVYALNGTIAITHGGIEIGQGINTKVSNKSTGRSSALVFHPSEIYLSHSISFNRFSNFKGK